MSDYEDYAFDDGGYDDFQYNNVEEQPFNNDPYPLQEQTQNVQPLKPTDEIEFLPEIGAIDRVEFINGLNLESLGIDIEGPNALGIKRRRIGVSEEQLYLIELYKTYRYLKKRGLDISDLEFTEIVMKLGSIQKPFMKNPIGIILGYKVVDRKARKIEKKKFDMLVKDFLPTLFEYRFRDVDLLKYSRLWEI